MVLILAINCSNYVMINGMRFEEMNEYKIFVIK